MLQFTSLARLLWGLPFPELGRDPRGEGRSQTSPQGCTIKGIVEFVFNFAKSLYEKWNIVPMNKDITTVTTVLPQ